MQSNKFGKAAVITTVFSVALAAIDRTDVADRLAMAVGMPVKWLPVIYISFFGLALWFVGLKYESADDEFVGDPVNDYGYETASGHEFYRVTVLNSGHTRITATVNVDGIAPLPRDLSGKLGMPLVPMGASSEPDGSVVINPGRKHS